jgi:hypothetical protein
MGLGAYIIGALYSTLVLVPTMGDSRSPGVCLVVECRGSGAYHGVEFMCPGPYDEVYGHCCTRRARNGPWRLPWDQGMVHFAYYGWSVLEVAPP